MTSNSIKTANRRRLAIGVASATVLSAVIIGIVALSMFNVTDSLRRFGFHTFWNIHHSLLDTTRLSDALKIASLAPEKEESLEYLAEANDLAYIRFVTEDHTQLITDVPAFERVADRMVDMIAVVDIVLEEGVPMDVPKLHRVDNHVEVTLHDMNQLHFVYGTTVDEALISAKERLHQLAVNISLILAFFTLLTIVSVILLVKRHEVALYMKHQATHDMLTDLKNRSWLTKNNEKMFDDAHLSGRVVMLFLIDLDHFKEVNDTYGHHIGDELLKYVADALHELEDSKGDVVAIRFGGDEMALLAIVDDNIETTTEFRAKVHQRLNTTVELSGVDLRVGASVGVAVYPQHGGDLDSLSRKADIALYKAKTSGRARIVVFDPEVMGGPEERGNLQARAREAIVNDEFELYWQPLFNLRDGSLAGAEAFLRWNDSESGRVLMPQDFLPMAEQSDLIFDIDRMVLMQACAEGARWEAELSKDFVITANISARHLQTEDFPSYLANVARRAGMSPGRLEIDISEDVIVSDRDFAFRTVGKLRDLGFRIALDDFGKGTADLQYLVELDINSLKIDGSFIRGIERSPKKQKMVKSIIESGQSAGAQVIAEGVETQQQMAFLLESGCDLVQGYLFARPTNTETFRSYLARSSTKRINVAPIALDSTAA